ncbi:phycobilisome degradation protein NblB [Chamaesiphon minutus]|uniref:HEAT-like repeat protein n=1 Tax=Chamaesiphon minutus (strain ATCC 27169 / PCC 6605) TaxID=1173020 RepID=K9U8X7_CHAP6|nr:HEAT repeat domain-containing protein [Chamaesiphon minutus]AFY91547.1 HEAT-like repeat protein [Chamaesiphon minutus PCC 6605]
MSQSIDTLVNSENKGDRITALNMLREIEPAIAFGYIKQLVTDSNTRVRYAAVSQLASIGSQDLNQSLTILRDRLVNDTEPDVQAAAADAIGALKLTDAFDDLQNLYQSTPEWLVQFSIVAALGELGDPRGLQLLQTALTNETSLVQTAAIGSIGELGDPNGVESITPFVTSPDWQIRYQLARALRNLGGASAAQSLAILATDEVEQVAQEARG